MNKFIVSLLTLASLTNAHASLPEYFGTSPSTTSIGGQATNNLLDPANIFYVPAAMARAQSIGLSLNAYHVSADFEPISSIVITNSTNSTVGSSTDTTSGNAITDYGTSQSSSVNFVLPLKDSGAIAVSIFTPLGKIMETNSGDARLPEYVMYHSRYKRTQAMFSYARPWNENFSFSLGAHLGFQAGAHVKTQVSLGNNYGSSGTAKTTIKPSLAAILSMLYETKDSAYYFTFQQEMKSNLEATALGDITDPPLALINIDINTMIYYDPHILRFGYQTRLMDTRFDLLTSLEYQLWDKYKTPQIEIINRGGGVRSSAQFEKLDLRNTINPKVGLSYHYSDNLQLNAGLSYRQTPLKGDFSGSGNSIDSNTYTLAIGGLYRLKLFGQQLELGAAAQYHKLDSKEVTKVSGQENGANGVKIGSPGYKIGGDIIAASTGIKIYF